MEQDLYEKIQERKKEYEKMASGNYKELEELEKNSLVKRYIYLTKLKEYVDRTNFFDGEDPNIVIDTLRDYGNGKINETNEIWVFIRDFSVKDYKKVYNQVVIDKPEDAMVAVYRDAENNQREIVISLEDKEEFERTHKVVTGDMTILNEEDRYFNTRWQFFKLMIEEGQEVAVSKILEKYGVNKGRNR